MLTPSERDIAELRAQNPHGRASNIEIERFALLRSLEREVSYVADERLRDILETIIHLL
jgi:hypothetical protein